MAKLMRAAIFSLCALLVGAGAATAPPFIGAVSAQDTKEPPTPVNQAEIVETVKWRAWVDAMPGPNKRSLPFYVKGEVVLPLPGYKVVLAPPKGANLRAATLILELTITRIRKPDAQVLTSYFPFYANKEPPRRYTAVEIRYRGKTISRINRVSVIQ